MKVPQFRLMADSSIAGFWACRRGVSLALTLLMVTSASRLPVARAFSDANWISMNPSIAGADNTVYAAVRDDSGNLYIGGDFTVVGTVVAQRVAKWDGSSWTPLGEGIGGTVRALAVAGSNVYAGGYFTNAGGQAACYIARWDGNNWTPLGSGMNGGVRALAVMGSDVYAGGDFTMADGKAASYIAKWNGSTWSALGAGVNRNVSALAVSGSDLYAGGSFWTAGGNPAYSIAKWNGSAWSALGSGLGLNGVYALALSGNFVYAASSTGSSGRIDRWDGSSWTKVGSINGGFVYTLVVTGNYLYAGGDGYFAVEGGGIAYGIAQWYAIANVWSPLGSGMKAGGIPVYTLALSESELYAGGRFSEVGGTVAGNIAKWNWTRWSALGSGTASSVETLAVSGSSLYAGGSFTTSDGATIPVAQWNGSGWSALGSGVDGVVLALASSGTNVYAGGRFTTATGGGATNVPINRIARWNGIRWTVLGLGMNDQVSALAVSGNELYAAGLFTLATNAGGAVVPVNRIARWNGSSWSALGSGMDYVVFALSVSGSNLYAGGLFTWATNNGGGAIMANCVAKWNGSNWSALGSGISYGVSALAASGADLYAGGSFTTAGGNPASHIARWDGSSWMPLASGLNGAVLALEAGGTNLYAGGDFTVATNSGGAPVATSHVARWNGSNWSGLGSGLNNTVWALAPSGSDLYVGGNFTTAGGKVSAYAAQVFLPDLPALVIRRAGAQVIVSWPTAETAGFALERAGTLTAPTNWFTNSAPVINDGTNKSINIPAATSREFFRLRRR